MVAGGGEKATPAVSHIPRSSIPTDNRERAPMHQMPTLLEDEAEDAVSVAAPSMVAPVDAEDEGDFRDGLSPLHSPRPRAFSVSKQVNEFGVSAVSRKTQATRPPDEPIQQQSGGSTAGFAPHRLNFVSSRAQPAAASVAGVLHAAVPSEAVGTSVVSSVSEATRVPRIVVRLPSQPIDEQQQMQRQSVAPSASHSTRLSVASSTQPPRSLMRPRGSTGVILKRQVQSPWKTLRKDNSRSHIMSRASVFEPNDQRLPLLPELVGKEKSKQDNLAVPGSLPAKRLSNDSVRSSRSSRSSGARSPRETVGDVRPRRLSQYSHDENEVFVPYVDPTAESHMVKIDKLPDTLYYSTELSPAAQYCTLKGYEDLLIATLQKKCAPELEASGVVVERTQTPPPNFIAANEMVARDVFFDRVDPVVDYPAPIAAEGPRRVRIRDPPASTNSAAGISKTGYGLGILSGTSSKTRTSRIGFGLGILSGASTKRTVSTTTLRDGGRGGPTTRPGQQKQRNKQLTESFAGGTSDGDQFVAYPHSKDVPMRVVRVAEDLPLDDKKPVRPTEASGAGRKTATALRSILTSGMTMKKSTKSFRKPRNVRYAQASPRADKREGKGGGHEYHYPNSKRDPKDHRMSLSEALKYFESITSISASNSTLRSAASLESLARSSASSLSAGEREASFGELASMFSDSTTAEGSSKPPNAHVLHSYRLECATDLLDVLRARGTAHDARHELDRRASLASSGFGGRSRSSSRSMSARRSRSNSKSNIHAPSRIHGEAAARASLTRAGSAASGPNGNATEQPQPQGGKKLGANVEQEPPGEKELTFPSTSTRFRHRARDSESAISDFHAWRSQWTQDFAYTKRGAHETGFIDPGPVRSVRGQDPQLPPAAHPHSHQMVNAH